MRVSESAARVAENAKEPLGSGKRFFCVATRKCELGNLARNRNHTHSLNLTLDQLGRFLCTLRIFLFFVLFLAATFVQNFLVKYRNSFCLCA